MKTFKQYLGEAATRKDQKSHHTDYATWERDATKLGYQITHHVGVRPPPGAEWEQAKWTTAHKIEKQGGAKLRGSFSHQGHGSHPHGYLHYKYMPEWTVNTSQDKAQRNFGKGLEKKIIKPLVSKIKPIQTIKPQQSNLKNYIDQLGRNPTGVASGIPNSSAG